jgi:hypothetical protein
MPRVLVLGRHTIFHPHRKCTMTFLFRVLIGGLLVSWISLCAAAGETTETRLDRLAGLHDMTLPDAWTTLYVRQKILERVRRHLGDAGREERLGPQWTHAAPEWQAAERELSDAMWAAARADLPDTAWFRSRWRRAAREVLNDREIDALAAQLDSVPGPHLAATMDWTIAELVMTRLTFTDRVRMDFPGTEREAAAIQSVVQSKQDAMAFDYGPYPWAALFAWHDPGRKYFRDVGFRIVTDLNARMDAGFAAGKAAFDREATRVDPFIAAFRRRVGKGTE